MKKSFVTAVSVAMISMGLSASAMTTASLRTDDAMRAAGPALLAPIVEASIYSGTTHVFTMPLGPRRSGAQDIDIEPSFKGPLLELSIPLMLPSNPVKESKAITNVPSKHIVLSKLDLEKLGALPKAAPIKRTAITKPANPSVVPTDTASEPLPSGKRFTLRRSALAPMAYVEFCVKNRDLCVVSKEKEVKLTTVSLAILKRVNREVNQAILPLNDKGDVWQVNVRSGDCEDFALTKKARLLKLGFPANALRMAVAKTRRGEGHAVLIISTDRGDLVLDNRDNIILPYNDTDLRWVKVQGRNNPLLWHEV